MSLIFLLLFVFVFWPLIKFGWKIFRFNQEISDQNKRARQTRQQARQQQKPEKKKKIDPNVGEYVAFTEVEVSEESTHNSAGSTSYVKTEEQITDISWEDIK